MNALVDPGTARIKILAETSALGLDTNKIARFLSDLTNGKAEIEVGVLFDDGGASEADALKLALCKVTGNDDSEDIEPFPVEIDYELRRIKGQKMTSSPFYDGFKIASLFRDKLSINGLSDISIVYTDRLVGSFGEDYRWHARTVMFSYPCVVSTTGIVQAPAKSKQYYLAKQLVSSMSKSTEVISDPEDHIRDINDPRIQQASESYAAQALFFSVFGEPFCSNNTCQLFNSHWQKHVLSAQVSGELCGSHERMIEAW